MKAARRAASIQGLRACHRRLLQRAERPADVLAVQQFDDRFLLQQGCVQEPRASTRTAPVTWPDVDSFAAKLKASGSACAYSPPRGRAGCSWKASRVAQRLRSQPRTTASTAWTPAWSSTSRCTCATSSTWPNMAKQGLFAYKPASKATGVELLPPATAGCSSARRARYATIKKYAKFDFGDRHLPYYPDVAGAPQNTIIGGASLWVMTGKNADTTRAWPSSFQYLSDPEGRSPKWHRTRATCPSRQRLTS